MKTKKSSNLPTFIDTINFARHPKNLCSTNIKKMENIAYDSFNGLVFNFHDFFHRNDQFVFFIWIFRCILRSLIHNTHACIECCMLEEMIQLIFRRTERCYDLMCSSDLK